MPIWMVAIEWLARLILLGLFGLSIWSIAIIFDRKKKYRLENPDTFLGELKKLAVNVPDTDREKVIAPAVFQKKQDLEKGLGVLGTLGSTTPFIGLLGTILGIIVAFGQLSTGRGDTNTVMLALAEALILTAVGLFVAIPAVIAFNIFKRRVRDYFDQVRSEWEHSQVRKTQGKPS